LIASQSFQSQWKLLYNACPWGTVHQDVPFVTIWYDCYASAYEPLVVTESNGDGELLGALFLAICRASGDLAQCGTHQAEYHVWLAAPENSQPFIETALTALAEHFPQGTLTFLFLPPGTPLQWSERWSSRCFLRPMARPLMSTRPEVERIQESLKKKANKSKLNRLRKLGELQFDVVSDPAEFDAALQEMTPFYDLRQTSLSGAAPFSGDARKAEFYRRMIREPHLLHVTTMRVGGRLVSMHMGPINRGQILVGVLAHSPFYEQYSAGKLHLLKLGAQMQQDGFEALDLTPGGDYKERFASDHDEAYVLTVFLSFSAARRYKRIRSLIGIGERFVSTDRLKAIAAKIRHKFRHIRLSQLPAKLIARIRARVFEHREMRVYVLPASEARERPREVFMNRDSLDDLLLYEPSEAWQPTLQEFARIAIDRMADRCHIYSRVENGRLVHWGWLIEHQETSELSEVGQTIALPPGSATLFDYYTRPEYRGRGCYRRSLQQMMVDAACIPGVENIVISVLASNRPSRHVIEKAGFLYWRSFHRRRIAGQTRRW
jgi:CelD/BcsL family acetyltransferase involved in cellulose biosynthesis/RimJ/RimL family protein N-acetyltransferase